MCFINVFINICVLFLATYNPKMCKSDELFCDNICLNHRYICDGNPDCSDGMDEKSCSSRKYICVCVCI